MIQIVVSRYNEDIAWTKQFENVLIYNKGDILEEEKIRTHVLPNVGREGHTYYKHICDNYDKLADYTVFLQGHPFDHSPNIINDLQQLDEVELKKDISLFKFLTNCVVETTFKEQYGKHYHCTGIYETYKRIFGKDCEDEQIIFGCGAQFIVSKENILNRPKSFYENIVKILEYHIDPFEGYDIERFHKYIFTT